MTKILIKDIIPFKDHPFRIEENDEMKSLMESINTSGLINPVIVRPKKDKYEMISGHRRLKAMELLGETEIETTIKELTDDEATILMVDSNCQRERMLPSERAFAYKMKLDAIKHQGKTCGHDGQKSRDSVSDESGRQIQRYIRLTYLIPELLEIVDDTFKYGKNRYLTMGLLPAVELSYLSKEEQKLVFAEIQYTETTPTHGQAKRIRELSKNKQLDDEKVEAILDEKVGIQNERITFNRDKIVKELPYELTKRDKRYIEDYIVKAIQSYRQNLERGDINDLDL